MAKEKEKPDTAEAPGPSTAVETNPEAPDKLAGPQPIARAAEELTAPEQGMGASQRARMVGSMQQNVGNARVGRMLAQGVQRKTEVSSPEDSAEIEADQMADKVMRMSDNDADATSDTSMGTQPGGAGGQPLSPSDRGFMEPRFGRSFENVRVHTDTEAQRQATEIGAKAFTRGSDISFGPGSGPDDKKLLAHELTHVAQQNGGPDQGVAAKPVMRAPGPLTAAEEASARRFTRNHYDERSVRIIQIITGTGVDGIFGDISAQAVATWQGPRGLAVDGKVGVNTLNQMVADRVAADRREHAIQLVVDFHDLNVTSDTLSVRFDPTLGATVGATAFEAGNLRVITLGPTAFTSEPTLRAAIIAQLAAPAPAVPAIGPRPTLLTGAQERSAISFNRSHFSDRRSTLAIQGHVGANPDAIFGPDTVERVADAQSVAGLVVDGKVGRNTLELFVTQLTAAGQQNTAIRLIVDFFNFRDAGNLLDVFFDPTEPDNASTDFRPNEPVRVGVGPSGMAQPFAGIVHTIAHEFEHVRRLREGIVSANTHEFLGEAVEILSEGMPEEAIENVAAGSPGFDAFMNDSQRAVDNWNLMPLADRQRFRLRFIAVRERVRTRLAAATPVQQALHAPILAAYNAVVVPPAP